MVRGTQFRGRTSGVRLTSRPRRTIIPSLDPITRRRARGERGIPPTARPKLIKTRPRPRPQQLGSDFGVLQPFGTPRPRPTRVEVAQPSGREGRLITVSSRSILARGRKKKKGRKRKPSTARKRRVEVPRRERIPFIAPRRFGRPSTPVRKAERSRAVRFGGQLGRRTPPPATRFFGLQDITFGEGRRREGRLGEFEEREERPRRRRAPPRRRRQEESDFGLGNVFDIQF